MGQFTDEQLLEYFVSSSSILYLKLSESGIILGANEYAFQFSGKELINENLDDLLVSFREPFDLQKAIKNPEREEMLTVHSATGHPQSFYFRFIARENDIIALGRLDTDELEYIRSQIIMLNNELSNLNRELQKKNAQLKHLNAEKNRFLGMASHDLRKPIGLVLAYSDFIAEEAADVLDSEHLEFLGTIQKSCTFMKRLVDDFLDASAIEAGKFQMEFSLDDIKDVLDQSLQLNRHQAQRRKITLDVRCQVDPSVIEMDSAKIEQAVTNLVSNAIEHSYPEAKVIITLLTEEGYLKFSVQDYGPGIPADEMSRLFKPYEKTSVKKIGGEKSTGLGMLITRKIVEGHNGSIEVNSKLGEGTTISFMFPLDRRMQP